MRFCSLIFFGTFLFSVAQAEPTPIQDPNRILDQADRFISAGTTPLLSSAFHVGDSVVYDAWIQKCIVGCGPDGCGQACMKFKEPVPIARTVAECDAEKAVIFSDDGINLEISAQDFAIHNGNLARYFLEQLRDFMGFETGVLLISAESTQFKIDPNNPSEIPLEALNLSGELVLPTQGTHHGPAILLTLVRPVPGVAQVARFRIGSDTWFRLKSYTGMPRSRR